MDYRNMLKDFCLFILGMYGGLISEQLCVLVQRRAVQKMIWNIILFLVVYMFFVNI